MTKHKLKLSDSEWKTAKCKGLKYTIYTNDNITYNLHIEGVIIINDIAYQSLQRTSMGWVIGLLLYNSKKQYIGHIPNNMSKIIRELSDSVPEWRGGPL